MMRLPESLDLKQVNQYSIATSTPTNAFVKVERYAEDGETIVGDIIRYDKFVELLFKVMPIAMMKAHCGLGITGEAGELADCIKREIIYGKPLDRPHLIEELGDLKFYIQATQLVYGISEQEILQANADKLSERYAGLAYSDAQAIARADKKGTEA